MKDFVPLGTGNSRFLKSVENFKTLYPTYDAFVSALVAGTLPVDFNGINSAGIAQSGTPLNKSSLLTDDTAAALGLNSADPTINEALAALAQALSRAHVALGGYKGGGKSTSTSPNSLSFEFAPKVVLITTRGDSINYDSGILICASSSYTISGRTFGEDSIYVKTNGNTVSWYSLTQNNQLDSSGIQYDYVAIG